VPLIGRAATDALLDGVELTDASQRLRGDRRRSRCGEFIEATPDMGPAEGERDRVSLGQDPIAAIAIDQQDALERAPPLRRRVRHGATMGYLRQAPIVARSTSVSRSAPIDRRVGKKADKVKA
jgi:hypothetical protein